MGEWVRVQSRVCNPVYAYLLSATICFPYLALSSVPIENDERFNLLPRSPMKISGQLV